MNAWFLDSELSTCYSYNMVLLHRRWSVWLSLLIPLNLYFQEQTVPWLVIQFAIVTQKLKPVVLVYATV